jgi:hypothetical protein
MNFHEQDKLDVRSHLSTFGETILYKGVEILAVVDYAHEDINNKGQRSLAQIFVASEDVVTPEKEDAVILPNAGTYTVEDIIAGEKNAWKLQLRDKQRSGLGRVKS